MTKLPLMKANFIGGPNPVPVKAALALMGLCSDNLRMPLMPLDEPYRGRMRMLLATLGLGGDADAETAASAASAGVGSTTERSSARVRTTAGARA